ncbi:hypothetical protein O7631_01705 [Micromonospora sp. WMMD967]|uniref:hypothetical protein n=1 Tax=Micromonospora sp. WMMD967 TaxID=3016101 RepID=UPI002415D375|nr:hypothetical protein [Micromonospora sp. WMMD967]MDG4835230.1 hypothetical protein [Micromonospora sp. WMMD967]
MKRDTLIALLDATDGDVYESCRDALRAGYAFKVFDGAVPIGALVTMYRRRERHTRARGIRTLGFVQALDRLVSAEDLGELLIGQVGGAGTVWFYQLFLAPDGSRVVACFAIGQDKEVTPRPSASDRLPGRGRKPLCALPPTR